MVCGYMIMLITTHYTFWFNFTATIPNSAPRLTVVVLKGQCDDCEKKNLVKRCLFPVNFRILPVLCAVLLPVAADRVPVFCAKISHYSGYNRKIYYISRLISSLNWCFCHLAVCYSSFYILDNNSFTTTSIRFVIGNQNNKVETLMN